jgi:predicted  nucleic acid-binding Zn-ribbon protein
MPHQCTGCGHTFEDGSKEMLSGCPDCGGNKFQFRPAGSADPPTDGDEPSTDGNETAIDADTTASSPESPDQPETDASSVAETVGRATTRVRDFVASDPTPEPEPDAEWPDEWESGSSVRSEETSSGEPIASSGEPEPNRSGPSGPESDERSDDDIIDADARRSASERGEGPKEDAAQASARTDVISSEELDGQAVTDEGSEAPTDRSPPEPDPAPDGEVVSEPTGEEPDLTELRAQLNDQFESIKILEPGQYELNLMELYDREEYIIALQENGRYVIQVPEQWIGEDVDDR